MADAPKPKTTKPKSPGVTVTDAHTVPVVYFDGACNFGYMNGVINVTLAMNRHTMISGNAQTDAMAVAHLRCSTSAARDLLRALQSALAFSERPPETAH